MTIYTTPETSGASAAACRAINAILDLDGLTDTLAHCGDVATFAASLARVIDREIHDNDPLAKLAAVCDGWSESRPGGLVCTRNRKGGIIDDTYPVPDKPQTWFVIFNDGRPGRDGFATRDEAIDWFVESSRAAG